MHVYDTVEARFVDEGDLILLDGDQIEVNQKIDSGEVIMFKGVSFIEGDNVERIVDASRPIDLWTEDA